jgi:HK97 gp10 family phage protein
MASDVHITGLKELHALLQALPVKIEKNIMRAAMRQGAKVIAEQARANVPVAAPSDRNRERYGGYAGALRDSIRVGGRSRRGRVTAYIRAGGTKTKGGADVFYARWVEYGTKPHANGRRGFHPGARPHPFLRPAADTAQGEAVVAVGKWIYRRLETRGGMDVPLSQIDIGEEE